MDLDSMTLLVHPLYNFLKYDVHRDGYHTGWYMDLHENDVAVVDFDIRVLSDDDYAKILKDLDETGSTITFTVDGQEVVVCQNERSVVEKVLSAPSISTKKAVIRDFIMRNVRCEYGDNDYFVITGSGGLHYYYSYKNDVYAQRNIKCIRTIFYEVDVLLGGPNHSFVVCPTTVAMKDGVLGEYKSPCINFNDAFPSPYTVKENTHDNIKRDSLKMLDDAPETEALNSYMFFNWISGDIVYNGHSYSKKSLKPVRVTLPSALNKLPEEVLEFCDVAKKECISEWDFMESRPQKTLNAVFKKNSNTFRTFILGLIKRGVRIHCTAHPGSSYTSELTLLHLLGSFSNFNNDMRAEFFKILRENPKALTPNAYRNLTKPHKRVKRYREYTLEQIVNYYTEACVHFYF